MENRYQIGRGVVERSFFRTEKRSSELLSQLKVPVDGLPVEVGYDRFFGNEAYIFRG